MATVHANKILTKFMLLLGGHNHCVKVSSDSETVRGMGLWEFSGALRELMLKHMHSHQVKSDALISACVVTQVLMFYASRKASIESEVDQW